MKALRLTACLLAMFIVNGCSSDPGGSDGRTPMGTAVSLAVFNGFFKGYTTHGTQHTGTQLSFGNMTGTVKFNNLTGARSRVKCTGSYTVVALGPTLFENQHVTNSTTSLVLLTGPTSPASIVSQRYFLISNGNLYKITNVPGILSYVPSITAMPPNPANVGEFGNLATLDGSDGSTLTIDWELSPEYFGNSIMTITSTTADILHSVTSTEVDRFYLDKGGNPYKLGVTITTSGTTISLTGGKT